MQSWNSSRLGEQQSVPPHPRKFRTSQKHHVFLDYSLLPSSLLMPIRSFVFTNPCLFSHSNFISLVWPVWNPVPARSGLQSVHCEVSCSQVSLFISNHRTGTCSLPTLQQLFCIVSVTERSHFTCWWVNSTSAEPSLFFIPLSHPTMGQSLFSFCCQVSEIPSLNLYHFPQFPNHTSCPNHTPSPNIL